MFRSDISQKITELVAVTSSLAYTWLYLQGNTLCWFFAFTGALLFLILCIRKNIFAEAFLQVFYLIMAIYGYWNTNEVWQENHWSVPIHIAILAVSVITTVLVYLYLQRRTSSVLPFTDSFTTVFAISGTVLMVNMIHLNWLYWIAVDAVSIYLYYQRGMKYGAVLFLIYLTMAVDGYFRFGIF